MLETNQIIYGIIAPLLIAIAAILPGCFIKPGEDGCDRFAWRIPLGLGLAVIVSFFGLHGLPEEAWQFAMYLPVAGVIAGCVLAVTKRSIFSKLTVFLVLAIASTLITWPVIGREAIVYKILPGAGILVLCLFLEPLVIKRTSPILPFGLMIATGCSSGIVLLSGHMDLAIPFGSLTLGLLVMSVIALWKRNLSLADGALAVIVPLLVTIPLIRWIYLLSEGTDVPVIAFILPTIAPLALWIGEIDILRKRSVAIAETLRCISLILICALAVYLAMYPLGTDDGNSDDPYTDMYDFMSGE